LCNRVVNKVLDTNMETPAPPPET